MTTQNKPSVPADAIERLAAKLEGQDPVQIQEELLTSLDKALQGLDAAALRKPEVPGKWSIIEVVQHLADTELAYGWRLRMILAQDTPPLQGFNQDDWTRELNYRNVHLQDSLDQLSAIRSANLRLLRSVPDARLDRVGIHSEAGPMSARMILYTLAAHDLTHLRQIDRIKKSLQ